MLAGTWEKQPCGVRGCAQVWGPLQSPSWLYSWGSKCISCAPAAPVYLLPVSWTCRVCSSLPPAAEDLTICYLNYQPHRPCITLTLIFIIIIMSDISQIYWETWIVQATWHTNKQWPRRGADDEFIQALIKNLCYNSIEICFARQASPRIHDKKPSNTRRQMCHYLCTTEWNKGSILHYCPPDNEMAVQNDRSPT